MMYNQLSVIKEIASSIALIRQNTPLSWENLTVDYYVNNVTKKQRDASK